MDKYIQGIKVGSLNEYNVGAALERLRMQFTYQYSILGGSSMRGGQILDFLVDRDPMPVPVLVQGEHWHANPGLETLREIMIEQYGGKYWDKLVKITEMESMTEDDALDAVKRKLL